MLEKHDKHSKIAKPVLGNFGRHEWAILGTNCTNVQQLADELITHFSPIYHCAYIDSSHTSSSINGPMPHLSFTDHIQYREIQYQQPFDAFQLHQVFNDTDMVLVNGNHHTAAQQIVVIDATKETSLQKRLTQLTNVQLIIIKDGAEMYDWLKASIQAIDQIPVVQWEDTEGIIAFMQKQMQERKAPLYGLVLAGGKSQRMGTDKGAIQWHGKAQRYFMADMLQSVCEKVFISCREDQIGLIENSYTSLEDTFTHLGPYGAILSAFRQQPDAAWLVVACDLPLLESGTIDALIAQRKVASLATTFESPFDGLPEPLITIWEPKAYPVLLSFLAQGYSCPRKVLRNNQVHIIKANSPEQLMNVNTVEEMAKAQQLLQSKNSMA